MQPVLVNSCPDAAVNYSANISSMLFNNGTVPCKYFQVWRVQHFFFANLQYVYGSFGLPSYLTKHLFHL